MVSESFILIEPFGNAAVPLMEAVIAEGYAPIIVTQAEVLPHLEKCITGSATDIVQVDFSNPDADIARELATRLKEAKVAGVTTNWEFFTPLVSEVAERMGLRGNVSSLGLAARNKIAMAGRLKECGVRHASTVYAANAAALLEAIENSGLSYPLVVKPAENAGSCGVSVIRDASEIETAVQNAQAFEREFPHGFPLDVSVLAQEYIGGSEYSVESVVFDGKISHLQVTQKETSSGSYRSEVGHKMPAVLTMSERTRIEAEAARAIMAVGGVCGAAHTEIKLWRGEAWVIEVGLRPGGDDIIRLVPLSTGIDFARCIVRACTGQDELPGNTVGYRVAGVTFLVPETSGTVTSIASPPRGPGIIAAEWDVKVGDTVEVGVNNISRIGKYILCADSRDEYEELEERVAQEMVAHVN